MALELFLSSSKFFKQLLYKSSPSQVCAIFTVIKSKLLRIQPPAGGGLLTSTPPANIVTTRAGNKGS